jgi:hypothetical protein
VKVHENCRHPKSRIGNANSIPIDASETQFTKENSPMKVKEAAIPFSLFDLALVFAKHSPPKTSGDERTNARTNLQRQSVSQSICVSADPYAGREFKMDRHREKDATPMTPIDD